MRSGYRGGPLLIGLVALASGCRTTQGSSVKDAATGAADTTTGVATQPPLELGEVPFVGSDGNDEAFWVNKLISVSDKVVNASKAKTGTATRSAHAKTHGCVTGTFTLATDRPQESRVGMFAQDGSFPVWVRFSNAAGDVGSDAGPGGRGMAVKVIYPTSEPKLLPGQESSNAIDFPFVSGPIFPVANVQDYFGLQSNVGSFLLSHPKEALKVAEVATKSIMKSPLNGTYWSMGSFKLGDQAVKFKTQPCQGTWFNFPLTTNPNLLRAAMIKSLMTNQQPACFDFLVQWQKSPTMMPVEDPSVEWRESNTLFSTAERIVTGEDPVSPFVKIGRIDIPAQAFTNPAITDLANRGGQASPQDDFCETLSFNPWRTLAIQHPLGNLMRARRQVYAASLSKRLALNQATPIGPQLTGTVADVAAAGGQSAGGQAAEGGSCASTGDCQSGLTCCPQGGGTVQTGQASNGPSTSACMNVQTCPPPP